MHNNTNTHVWSGILSAYNDSVTISLSRDVVSITESSSLVGMNMRTEITTGRCYNCDEWSLSQRTKMFKVFAISVVVSCHGMAITDKWKQCKEFASQGRSIWWICGKSLIKTIDDKLFFFFFSHMFHSFQSSCLSRHPPLSPRPILLLLIWLQ